MDKAIEFLKENSGSHFDPGCVTVFLNRIEEVLAIKARFQDEAIHTSTST